MVSFILSLAALVLVALILGVHLTGHIVLNPVLRAMDADLYIPVKRAIDITAPKLAKPLMLSSLTVTAAAVIASSITCSAPVVVANAVALVALIVTLLAILRGDLPINRSMANWSPEQPPADWHTTRTRWERFFDFRVAANAVALLAIVVAVLTSAAGLG